MRGEQCRGNESSHDQIILRQLPVFAPSNTKGPGHNGRDLLQSILVVGLFRHRFQRFAQPLHFGQVLLHLLALNTQ